MPPLSVKTPSAAPADKPLEEAAAWYVRLCAALPQAAERAAWQRWHDSAPEHRAAWSRVERLQGLLQQAPVQSRRALDAAAAGKRRRVLACAGVLLSCGLAWLLTRAPAEAPVEWIATAPGERRQLELADGSRVLLGSATTLGVAFDARQRRLILREGELQVQTGHRPAADGKPQPPLQLVARDGVLRPLGTRFSLHQDAQGSTLVVQEHAVELGPAPAAGTGAGRPLRIEAGQKLRFSADSLGQAMPATAADEAWSRGVLMVLEMPLARFAAELARQSGQPVECEERIAGLRVSGSYLVDQPGRSLQSVAALHGLRLQPRAEGGWRLAGKP